MVIPWLGFGDLDLAQDQLRVMGPAGFVVWRSTYFSLLK